MPYQSRSKTFCPRKAWVEQPARFVKFSTIQQGLFPLIQGRNNFPTRAMLCLCMVTFSFCIALTGYTSSSHLLVKRESEGKGRFIHDFICKSRSWSRLCIFLPLNDPVCFSLSSNPLSCVPIHCHFMPHE